MISIETQLLMRVLQPHPLKLERIGFLHFDGVRLRTKMISPGDDPNLKLMIQVIQAKVKRALVVLEWSRNRNLEQIFPVPQGLGAGLYFGTIQRYQTADAQADFNRMAAGFTT